MISIRPFLVEVINKGLFFKPCFVQKYGLHKYANVRVQYSTLEYKIKLKFCNDDSFDKIENTNGELSVINPAFTTFKQILDLQSFDNTNDNSIEFIFDVTFKPKE